MEPCPWNFIHKMFFFIKLLVHKTNFIHQNCKFKEKLKIYKLKKKNVWYELVHMKIRWKKFNVDGFIVYGSIVDESFVDNYYRWKYRGWLCCLWFHHKWFVSPEPEIRSLSTQTMSTHALSTPTLVDNHIAHASSQPCYIVYDSSAHPQPAWQYPYVIY